MADYRLCVEGDIDLATAPGLRADVIELLDRRRANVVIDFVGVTFMDCSGIRVLIELEHLLASSGHQLRLVHLPRRARLTIDVLGLADALHLDRPVANSAAQSLPALTYVLKQEEPNGPRSAGPVPTR
jgi:anti-sigma B factor antagonist